MPDLLVALERSPAFEPVSETRYSAAGVEVTAEVADSARRRFRESEVRGAEPAG